MKEWAAGLNEARCRAVGRSVFCDVSSGPQTEIGLTDYGHSAQRRRMLCRSMGLTRRGTRAMGLFPRHW